MYKARTYSNLAFEDGKYRGVHYTFLLHLNFSHILKTTLTCNI